MKIVIANDHAGVELKKELKDYMEGLGYEVINIGTDSTESCHYPEFGKKAAEMVASHVVDLGVLICGTGVGISLAANKVKGIRCGVCSETTTARLIRQHNNANMIAFGARIVGPELAKDIVKSFLDAEFEGGGRHQQRIDMISAIENEQ
ncbi:MAG: ribose 5-phosphate isomerase B [Pseudobutyrivibrio ruminis]|nr:ribose 5-phosphate isomerase B [Pseudobutyrivibrio ruminis]